MSEIPEFIRPHDVRDLSDSQFDTLLERIQASRLQAYILYMQAEKDKQLIRDEKMRIKLEHQLKMMGKEIARADKVIEALEKRVNNIRTIQLELGQLDD